MGAVVACLLLTAVVPGVLAESEAPKLLLAFSSFRDRPLHPRLYFYEHDGKADGKLAGGTEPVNLRVDTHATLTAGGRYCVYASELENQPSETRVWDVRARAEVTDLPGLNSEVPEVDGGVSADGRWILFRAWQRPGGPAGWSLYLYDLTEKKVTGLDPGVEEDKLRPAISGDGRYVAFAATRTGGAGSSDVYLYDRRERKLVPLPGLNSPRRDLDPALSRDGSLIAFTSDRTGVRDVLLYDRAAGNLLPLPGLNGPGIDHTPALTPDGRFLTFVSERVSGMGEGDVFLYDRELGKLLPTPGLNSVTDDFDPAVTCR